VGVTNPIFHVLAFYCKFLEDQEWILSAQETKALASSSVFQVISCFQFEMQHKSKIYLQQLASLCCHCLFGLNESKEHAVGNCFENQCFWYISTRGFPWICSATLSPAVHLFEDRRFEYELWFYLMINIFLFIFPSRYHQNNWTTDQFLVSRTTVLWNIFYTKGGGRKRRAIFQIYLAGWSTFIFRCLVFHHFHHDFTWLLPRIWNSCDSFYNCIQHGSSQPFELFKKAL